MGGVATDRSEEFSRYAQALPPVSRKARTRAISESVGPNLPRRMKITVLKPELKLCDECRRPQCYGFRLLLQSNVRLCRCCVVRLVVGLVSRIASEEAQHSTIPLQAHQRAPKLILPSVKRHQTWWSTS